MTGRLKVPVPLVSTPGDLAILPTSKKFSLRYSPGGAHDGFDGDFLDCRGERGWRRAAIGQVIGMTVVAVIIGALLLWIGYLHRARKITWVNSFAEWTGRSFKRPPWVALPIALFIATIICALFGFIWDVSLHIGKGRDPGPLANPAHYFILVGLFLLFVAGCAAIVLPYEKPGPFAIRITRNWYAPVGGVLMAGCGLYALMGFPLAASRAARRWCAAHRWLRW